MRIFKILSVFFLSIFLSSQSFAATYEALVTNYGSDTVSFVSLPGGVVTGTVSVGLNPNGIATTPDMKTAYVTNNGDNTVSVIDVVTHSVIATIQVGVAPSFVAITPDGTKAYVTNYISGNVSVIDTATNTVITTVMVGSSPNGIVMMSNGQKIYVTNFISGNVSVIDIATNTVIETIAVVAEPKLAAITPNNAYVYVPNYGSGNISVISTATDSVVTTLSSGSLYYRNVYVTPDGTKAYAPGFNSSYVLVINALTNTVEGTIAVGSGPNGVAFSADSAIAYVGNLFDGSISVVDVASSTVIDTITGVNSPNILLLTPDETQIALTSESDPGYFNLITVPTNEIAQSTLVESFPSYIAFGNLPSDPIPPKDLILPPRHLVGKQKQTHFVSQTEIFNVIRWKAPDNGVAPVSYNIYRDNLNTLIGIVPAGKELSFEDHNRRKNVVYTYYVVSEDSEGEFSLPVSVTVRP